MDKKTAQRSKHVRGTLNTSRIMEAASELFYLNGYQNTSMDDVAASLSVTKPALYYHFKSKEAILLACVQDAFDRFQGLMQAQALSAASGRDRLCVFLKNYLVITTGNFGISLVLSEPHVLSPEGRKLYVRYRNSINRQLMQILTQGISDGSVRTGDPTLTSYAIFGMFNWAAKWSPDKPEISNDEIFEHFMSVILSGIDGDTRPEQEGPKSGAAP